MTRPQTTSDSSTARVRPITDADALARIHRAVEDYAAGRVAELHLGRAASGRPIVKSYDSPPAVHVHKPKRP